MKKQITYLQKLFYDLWNDFGSVYLIVSHSDRTRIGKRGFTEEEQKRGLVLVFNNRTNTELDWDREGNLACVLAFGATREEVSIHHDDLRGVFSPEAGVQFLRTDIDKEQEPAPQPEDDSAEPRDSQVVSLHTFRKRKTGDKS